MTDLDQRIASVLRERADGEIDARRLLRGSRALGRRRQARRRVSAGTALALVGVLGFVGAVRGDVGGLAGRMPWAATTPGVTPPPVPPLADGVPGAATEPARVATDPQVLHFAVDPAQARYLGWSARRDDVESIRFTVGGGRPVLVEVSRSRDLLSQGGVEGFSFDAGAEPLPFDGSFRQVDGTGGGMILSWRPVAGLYARASTPGTDRDALRRAVEAVRWDEARRCAGPMRLTTLPPAATVVSCGVDVSSFPGGVNVYLSVARGTNATMRVRFDYAGGIAGSRDAGNRTVAGRPAYLSPDATELELLGIPKAHLIATFGGFDKGFSEAEAAAVLAGARLAEHPTDPKTWP
ncbi:hypothetical protein [Micromonospora sp. NPDC049282]|uniref:hypothetical protein n=1 Tax=Micromonospora sp. NPDC049282 TaxID=3364269 RepID=UPI003711AE83